MKARIPAASLVAAVALTLAAGCPSTDAPASCAEDTCPAGQVCQDGACVSLVTSVGTGDLGRHTAVALTDEGLRLVATFDTTHANLVVHRETEPEVFTTRILAGWSVADGVVTDTDHGRWVSTALDPDGARLHLAWYDATEGRLVYGRLDADDALLVEPVPDDAKAASGTHTAIAVANDGVVHIAYRDEGARALRHAERSLAGAWTSRLIDGCSEEDDCPGTDEDYGEYASVALVAGSPRIAFYDRLRGDLKMAEQAADGGWEVSTLDGRDPATGFDDGDVGRFAYLARGASQNIGVAYWDATRGALLYLVPSGAASEPVVVDDGVYLDAATGTLRHHAVGQHVALRFDAQGRPVMLYLDAGALTLRRAILAGSQVLGPDVLGGLPAGGWIDFGIDAGGRAVGAYGAWLGDGSTRTKLETFAVEAEP